MEKSSKIPVIAASQLCKEQQNCIQKIKCCQYNLPNDLPRSPCINYLDYSCDESSICNFDHSLGFQELSRPLNKKYSDLIPDYYNPMRFFKLNDDTCNPSYNQIDICEKGIKCEDDNCLQHHPEWLQENPNWCVKYIRSKTSCDGVFCNKQGKKHLSWKNILNDKIIKSSNTKDLKIGTNFYDFSKEYKNTKIFKNIDEEHIVNLLIVMDCTGSMCRYIQGCKESIKEVIEQFNIQLKNYILRVGFVGYRDFDCKEREFSIMDFTDVDKLDEINKFIDGVEAFGGGDQAENVKGAFEIVTNLKYCKRNQLCILLFADQPSHGKKYHDEDCNDNYQDVDGLEALIDKLPTVCRTVQFICVELSQTTKKMYEIFAQSFSENKDAFQIVPKVEPNELTFLFMSSLTSTVKLQQSKLKDQIIKIQTLKLSKEEAKDKTVRKAIGYKIVFSYQIDCPQDKKQWENLQNNIKFVKYKTNLKIAKNPLELKDELNGTSSKVFEMKDVVNNRNLIGKIQNSIINENCQPQQELEVDQSRDYCFQKLMTQAYSCFIAKMYRNEKNHVLPIFYLPVTLFELESEFQNSRFIFAEPKLEKFEKFTNNENIATDPLISGFSHYSYMKTDETFAIVDLQGQKGTPKDETAQGYILSDPAIHSEELKDVFTEDTNLHLEGVIRTFIEQHQSCNITICQNLDLKKPKILARKQKVRETIEDYPLVLQNDSKVVILCDICNEIKLLNYKAYKNQIQKQGYVCCKECEPKCKAILQQQCKNPHCKQTFKREYYYDQVNNLKPDRKCEKCIAIVTAECGKCKQISKVQKSQKDIIENEMKNEIGDDLFICASCIKNNPKDYEFLLIEMKYFNTRS